MTDFVRDAWYAAAAAEELGGERPLARRLLGERFVLWRTSDGTAAALRDRCPHRSAPLSMGAVRGDTIECPYHGMAFDGRGHCVRVPGQDRIPSNAVVRSLPVVERYGLVFVWPGDPARADEAQLLDIPQFGVAGWGLSRGYAHWQACWLNIIDNLVDPAHTSFVHQRTIGNAAAEEVSVAAEERDGVIVCGRWVDDAPAVPIVQRFANPRGNVDRWQFYHLRPPCTSWVDFGALEAGRPHTAEEQARAPYRVLSYAFLTPETHNSTHYFSFQLRNFAAEDASVTAEFNQLYKATFEEDRALLEAIQREEDEHPGVPPVRIASDSGVVRLRRAVERMAGAERT